jgi:polysaccharide biosynthesis transport protein
MSLMLEPPTRSNLTLQDQLANRPLQRFQHAFRRDWWIAAGMTAVTGLAAVLFTLRQDPLYESSTTLLIQQRAEAGGVGAQLDPRIRLQPGGLGLDTDILVLRSRQLAEAVADSLGLWIRQLEPRESPAELLKHIEVDASAAPGIYRLVSVDASRLRLTVPDGTSYALNAGSVERPAAAGVSITSSDAVASIPPGGLRFEILPIGAAADELRGAIFVSRVDPHARVVQIQFQSGDPLLAAAVPNVYADKFIQFKERLARTESGASVTFLREQVETYQQRLFEAEERVRLLRETDQIVNLEEESKEQVTRLVQLQAQKDEVTTELSALDRLLTASESGTESGLSPYRQLASFPFFLANRAVQDLLLSLMELENQRAELLVRRTPENLDVVALDRRITELEFQLYQMARNYRSSFQNRAQSLEASLANFNRELSRLPAMELQFVRLTREREMLAEMYVLLQQMLKEAEIQNAAKPGDVHVVDVALVPEAPVGPRPLFNLLVGLLGGLILGTGTVFIRSRLDDTIHLQEDARAAAVDLPLVGMIPRFDTLPSVLLPYPSGSNGRRRFRLPMAPPPADLRQTGPGELVMLGAPDAMAADAFRGVHDSLHAISEERPIRSIVLTSVLPGDGKSTAAANLALAYAEQGVRTLLVDADFRRGRLHKLFDLPAGPGLWQVLRGRATLEEALRTPLGTQENLFLLSAGLDEADPPRTGVGRKLTLLLEKLQKEFEVVIVDAPPIGFVAQASLLAARADAVILVARIGATEKALLEEAVGQISKLPTPVRGLLLNDVPVSEYSGTRYAMQT